MEPPHKLLIDLKKPVIALRVVLGDILIEFEIPSKEFGLEVNIHESKYNS